MLSSELQNDVPKKRRLYNHERSKALEKKVERLAALREQRDRGELGDECIKLAQALILCTLPYRPTKDRQIVRRARLSDGSALIVTFTAGLDGVAMPFGADRDVMAWLFDRAINSESPFVSIRSASDYLKETGKARNNDRVKELGQRLQRISGLVIGIERKSEDRNKTQMIPIIADANLPRNLKAQLDEEDHGQEELPGVREPFGILLEERFFADIRRHYVAFPRPLWLALQGIKAGPAIRDLITFFVYRCYCAQSETVIPWHGLKEQFPQDDSNPRRLKQNAKAAIAELRIIWPEIKIAVVDDGIWVGKTPVNLLPDDPRKKRIRRLDSQN